MSDAITRGNCFKLLAACFYEPDRDMFLEERVCENLQDLLGGWAGGAAKAAENMALSLRVMNAEQLGIDHAALFIGPFELLAPPYGSVYLENRRQVMGDSTMEVQQRYHEAGLEVDVREPPDHIAIELEFMHYLCMREAKAESKDDDREAATCREKQAEFLSQALHWVPQLCYAIREGSDNPFYTDLANCLERFMVACGQVYREPSAPSKAQV